MTNNWQGKKTSLGFRQFIPVHWPGTVLCCRETFNRAGAFLYHIEKRHVRARQYCLVLYNVCHLLGIEWSHLQCGLFPYNSGFAGKWLIFISSSFFHEAEMLFFGGF